VAEALIRVLGFGFRVFGAKNYRDMVGKLFSCGNPEHYRKLGYLKSPLRKGGE
jgi:hypothetical protein